MFVKYIAADVCIVAVCIAADMHHSTPGSPGMCIMCIMCIIARARTHTHTHTHTHQEALEGVHLPPGPEAGLAARGRQVRVRHQPHQPAQREPARRRRARQEERPAAGPEDPEDQREGVEDEGVLRRARGIGEKK